MLSVRQFEIL